jgi:hypothetical protein
MRLAKMFQEIILYDWRHICWHCYVANRSITSWLVYLAARLALHYILGGENNNGEHALQILVSSWIALDTR